MSDRKRFEDDVLPHVDAAYNLARWLTRNDHDAEDVLQEAMLRAFRFHAGMRGAARPWLLAIVRNTCFSWLQQNRPADVAVIEEITESADDSETPETLAARFGLALVAVISLQTPGPTARVPSFALLTRPSLCPAQPVAGG